ncbi:LysR family transcriptional regulator [Kibdelosporangium persicum]|uniref:HTH-type transcriptional regulator CysL n=1 Tax=Kibdelosporangium persicum TaxID=2698649 RepID=A0ABX2EYN5_9PSEU|nr:LysR family transcriptional regulator [Kibdelosporangium persicum]NRN63989.1 HTH-type transcriptional regulator CysL [Kibdelosporangium persicum]
MFPAESLPAFLVFAERLNFTAAARELHISQPALHVKVRKLAEAVGRPLYVRHGKRLVLTAEGEALARFARERADQLDQFLAELGGEQRRVALAAGQGAYLYLLGDVIARESERLRLFTASRAQTLTLVRDGRAQLGVSVLDELPDDLDTVKLATYDQVLVVPHDHPLASRDQIRLPDLTGMRMVLPHPAQPLRVSLERLRSVADFEWEVAVEAGGWPLMLHFVELGVGAAVVNGCVRTDLAKVPIVDLPPVPYYAIHRPGARADRRVAQLLDQICHSLGST